jgi:hypothetical protein
VTVTFAAVGSSVPVTSSSFSLTPSAAGDFVLAQMNTDSATDYPAAMSSSNVAWAVLAGPVLCPADSFYSTVFIGRVTSATAATVTVSYNAGSPGVLGHVHEYSATAGFAAVTLDGYAVTGSAAGTAYPSLIPGHGAGELYYCWAYNDGTASAGATSGYTYYADPSGNGACWNTSCTTGTQTPAWADSNKRDGIAVLLYEASAPPYTLRTPPGLASPMAWQYQARPTAAPLLVTQADTGTGTDSATAGTEVPGGDTGTGADTGAPVVEAADTGTGADSTAITATVPGADTGTGTDSGVGRPLMRVRWSAADKLSKTGGTMHP